MVARSRAGSPSPSASTTLFAEGYCSSHRTDRRRATKSETVIPFSSSSAILANSLERPRRSDFDHTPGEHREDSRFLIDRSYIVHRHPCLYGDVPQLGPPRCASLRHDGGGGDSCRLLRPSHFNGG